MIQRGRKVWQLLLHGVVDLRRVTHSYSYTNSRFSLPYEMELEEKIWLPIRQKWINTYFYFPDDELFSDTYKVNLIDGVLYEVVGKVRMLFLTKKIFRFINLLNDVSYLLLLSYIAMSRILHQFSDIFCVEIWNEYYEIWI